MLLQEEIDDLIEQARQAAGNAYCPYSDYPVGAVILTENGETFWGCNVENVSFGAGICAERVAAGNAIANGYTDFRAIAIFHDGEDLPYPCGVCRQFLSEFGLDLTVIVATNETYEIFSLASLLPHAFDTKEVKS